MKIYHNIALSHFINSFLVINEFTSQAILIDPSEFDLQVVDRIESNRCELSAVLITRNRPCNTDGLATLMKVYSPQIYCANMIFGGSNINILRGDGVRTIAGLEVQHISLPGHSSDAMVYKIGQVIFTGESLTAAIIGETATQFSRQLLIENIRSKIFTMPDSTVLFPGMGPPSTIGAEKRFNSAFQKTYGYVT